MFDKDDKEFIRRYLIMTIVREVLNENGVEYTKIYSDHRSEGSPSSIAGHQLKYYDVWDVSNKVMIRLNTALAKHNAVAVLTTHDLTESIQIFNGY